MAESAVRSTVSVVPLKGQQLCNQEGASQDVVDEGRTLEDSGCYKALPMMPAAAVAACNSRKDKALATLVLSVEPSLLCLIEDTEDPNTVWMKPSNQFSKKSWKLELRRKLHSMKLKLGDSVQEHFRLITELFNALAEIESPLFEEDRLSICWLVCLSHLES